MIGSKTTCDNESVLPTLSCLEEQQRPSTVCAAPSVVVARSSLLRPPHLQLRAHGEEGGLSSNQPDKDRTIDQFLEDSDLFFNPGLSVPDPVISDSSRLITQRIPRRSATQVINSACITTCNIDNNQTRPDGQTHKQLQTKVIHPASHPLLHEANRNQPSSFVPPLCQSRSSFTAAPLTCPYPDGPLHPSV